MKKVKNSLFRGWGCGLVLGIIPAAGGSIAQWIAYAWEIQKSKIGDQFGKGEIKGLAAKLFFAVTLAVAASVRYPG